MTWTPVTQQGEMWTANTVGLSVFSTLVFSHASNAGLRVFSMKSADGNREVWDAVAAQSETWVAV